MNWNGVRQHISRFRQEQKRRFEELGWAVPEFSPVKGTSVKGTPKKRKGSDAEGEETPTKGKKRKGAKGAVSETVLDAAEEGGEEGTGGCEGRGR